MANIAIDARPLANPTDGIARFTHEIASRLVQNDEQRWFLYTHAPMRVRIDSAKCRVAPGPLANSLASSQLLFPHWAKEDQIDVFWSPRHHLPLTLATQAIVTIHDLCWKAAPQTMPQTRRITESFLTPRSIKKADIVTTVSQATLSHMLKLWPSLTSKSCVVEPGRQQFGVTQPHKAARPYILSVGTIEPRKNYALLLESFGRIHEKVPHDLVVIGRAGWGGVDIEKMAHVQGLSARVKWISEPTDLDLAAHYKGADLYVTCSTCEGFNLPILEAISCGTPVMASDLPVHREVAGACGRYFNANVDDAAQALYAALTDHAGLATLAQRCPAKAAEYSWDHAASRMLELMLDVAN